MDDRAAPAARRASRVAAHLGASEGAGANSGALPADVAALPLPPVCTAANGIFPSFPEMLDHMKQVGGVFSYEIIGGRRITIIADPELYEVVFSPDEMGATPGVGDAVKVEMDKLAHAWFGIPRPIVEYTKPSLASVRRAIGPQRVVPIVNQVGRGVKAIFDALPEQGSEDLVKIAHATFWPVNQAMFGKATLSAESCPHAPDWFHQFDEFIPQVTGGMPASMFEEMQEAATKIVDMFERSIANGNHHDASGCPVLHDRFAPIPEDQMQAFSDREKAQFMISLFWAPQANTLPMTWWALGHIIRDERIRRNVEAEVRAAPFRDAPDANGDFPFDEDALPYTHACMKETLRLYIANLTHRHVARDIPVRRSDGTWLRIPAKDMLSVASYTRHYDPDVYSNPAEFRPERWLGEEKHGLRDYWPFALGKYSCSGKFLAQGEIPLLIALFLRDFDTELLDPMPEADWDRVVASVRPQGWPYDTNCRVAFKRRATAAKE